MAFSSADLAALDAAIAAGVTEVRFADMRVVRYGTTADLLKARAFIASQITPASAGGDPLQMAGGLTVCEFSRR